MDKPFKTPPPYAVASIDNALRAAAMLQIEGPMAVHEVAQRLSVAPSTAHRLLQMLVYRDFAVQDANRAYRAGPVLELAGHSQSVASYLRTATLPSLRWLVDVVHETAGLMIRTGVMVRFIASVECDQSLRVGSREGMVFPAHLTSGGLLMLAELPVEELTLLYPVKADSDHAFTRSVISPLVPELAVVRKTGFAINAERSEHGVTAIGVVVRDKQGVAVASLSISLPSTRFRRDRLPPILAALRRAGVAVEASYARLASNTPADTASASIQPAIHPAPASRAKH